MINALYNIKNGLSSPFWQTRRIFYTSISKGNAAYQMPGLAFALEIEANLISALLRRISVANRGGLGYNEDNEPRLWEFWPSGAAGAARRRE
ncbi:MAG: hypothetical protein LUE91_06725 [Oscillospiraceae bacterium]|nr:hypothetical protein [Oscillospiraceae bacterium]